MPYKDPARKKANAKAYYAANRDADSARSKAYYASHKERAKALAKARYEANPEKAAENSRKWYEANRGASNASCRKYRAANPNVSKAYHLKRLYDIPKWLAPYIIEHMTAGTCPGCGVKFGHPQSMARACIDHDHDTGLVRMIVCNLCNTRSLRESDDGRDPDALLLAAGRNVTQGGRKRKERAIRQVRLAALLIDHYAERSPLVAKALSIPLPD